MSDWLEEVRRQDANTDAMLLGRQTFEDFRGYWPHQTDDTSGITEYLNRVQKYVVSSTLTEPGWENTTVLAGDAVEEVRALKDRPGGDIVLTGSITLAHAMIEAGLVDEYRLFTYPAVQGRGRRLFPDGFRLEQLQLTRLAVVPVRSHLVDVRRPDRFQLEETVGVPTISRSVSR